MHIITSLGTGGAESMLAALVLAPGASRPSPLVVSLISGGSVQERLLAGGITVESLGMSPGMPSLPALFSLVRLIRRERPQVIQSWMYHADLIATVALALSGRWSRTRLAWGVRCSDMDLSLYHRGLSRVVHTCARLSRLPHAVIANSEVGRAVHEALGYRPARFEVIPNGIDTYRFRPDPEAAGSMRAQLQIANGEPVVTLVARRDPMKDHDSFLKAFRRLDGVHAILVGAGTTELPDLPRLHKLGRRDDVAAVLAAADVVALSSAFGEGFPNALAEGMACGLVPVSTEVGDTPAMVGDTGYLVPPRDPEALAGAITQVLSRDRACVRQQGLRARERIVRQFSLDRAVEAFDRLHWGLARELPDTLESGETGA